MKVHFIAIGGSAMHNLAIALHKKGYPVTGSDDEIFEPSKSRLKNYGLYPDNPGWFPEKIDKTLDAVILGMHAREDNPELLKAQDLGLKIYSYPEYVYQQTRNKTRVVIAGSHGKTSITSMIMHVLKFNNVDFDYLVGAQIEGFDTMVYLSDNNKLAVFEGDEYLSSPIDPRPKFLHYHPHIALISGIAWDHINVFPTVEKYVEQFRKFLKIIDNKGNLYYSGNDPVLKGLVNSTALNYSKTAYFSHPHTINNGTTLLSTGYENVPVNFFGEHNMQNVMGAKLICNKLGISEDGFYDAMKSFMGASRRLQLIRESVNSAFFLDFAHAPSKLKATINAVKKQFPERKLLACIELHTFSSLNKHFLPEYKNTLNEADFPMVYFNPHTLEHKKLPVLGKEDILKGFNNKNIHVYTDTTELKNAIIEKTGQNLNYLMMSSGNFSGMDLSGISKLVIG